MCFELLRSAVPCRSVLCAALHCGPKVYCSTVPALEPYQPAPHTVKRLTASICCAPLCHVVMLLCCVLCHVMLRCVLCYTVVLDSTVALYWHQAYLPAPHILKRPLTKSTGSAGMGSGRHLQAMNETHSNHSTQRTMSVARWHCTLCKTTRWLWRRYVHSSQRHMFGWLMHWLDVLSLSTHVSLLAGHWPDRRGRGRRSLQD
jgi:hypothetical protein